MVWIDCDYERAHERGATARLGGMSALKFDILHRDTNSRARVGNLVTPHGAVQTPAFMPVGTQGAVKGLSPSEVVGTGAQIILANTYHLMLRPGSELVEHMGGLHRWMRWDGPILTDSGGFQVFSLADINRITDQGVTFRSHVDGSSVELTPKRSIQVQNQLGGDIIMAFDDCPPAAENGSGVSSRIQQACDRTAIWLEHCIRAHQRPQDQALFGIVQGGTDLEARRRSVDQVCGFDLLGYAIGGVAVGEGPEAMAAVVDHTAALLPADRPRYLMGVGYERDLLLAVRAGVDLFDCVLPTRNGRNGNAFTPTGPIRLRNARFATEKRPIDETCDCVACGGGFSCSYIRHLFAAGEMLGPILVSLHNLHHFQRLLLDIRSAIADNDLMALVRRWPVAR